MTVLEVFMLDGWVKLYRKILHSPIFKKKAEYLKIFFYVLCKVNHADGLFPKGSNFFNFKEEIREIPNVSLNQVYEFLRWAKKERMIKTQKTTRGVIIKVTNWELYQDSKQADLQDDIQFNYKITTSEKQLKHNTINKNDKNNENERKSYIQIN